MRGYATAERYLDDCSGCSAEEIEAHARAFAQDFIRHHDYLVSVERLRACIKGIIATTKLLRSSLEPERDATGIRVYTTKLSSGLDEAICIAFYIDTKDEVRYQKILERVYCPYGTRLRQAVAVLCKALRDELSAVSSVYLIE